MIKPLQISTLIFLAFLISCGSGHQDPKERELEFKQKELELREREIVLQEKLNKEVTRETESLSQNLTQEELQNELGERECNEYGRLISAIKHDIEGNYKNFLSFKINSFDMSFSIDNNATISTFGTIKLKLIMLDSFGEIIKSYPFTVDSFVGPGESIRFTERFSCTDSEFQSFASSRLEVIKADCLNSSAKR